MAVFADNSIAIAYLRNQGEHQVSFVELHRTADPVLGGFSAGGFSSSVYHGASQRSDGLSVLPQPSLRVGVDPQDGSFSESRKEVASFHRPVRYLAKSPRLSIFFSVPRFERIGARCSAPELEWVAGICLSSLVSHSGSSQEAPVVIWNPPNDHGSVWASEAMVSGSSGSGGGRSIGSSSVSRSDSSAPLSSTLSGGCRGLFC